MKKLLLFLVTFSMLSCTAQQFSQPSVFSSNTDNLLHRILVQLGGRGAYPIAADTNNRLSITLDSIHVALKDTLTIFGPQLTETNNLLSTINGTQATSDGRLTNIEINTGSINTGLSMLNSTQTTSDGKLTNIEINTSAINSALGTLNITQTAAASDLNTIALNSASLNTIVTNTGVSAVQYNLVSVINAPALSSFVYAAGTFHSIKIQVFAAGVDIYVDNVLTAGSCPAGAIYDIVANGFIQNKIEISTPVTASPIGGYCSITTTK